MTRTVPPFARRCKSSSSMCLVLPMIVSIYQSTPTLREHWWLGLSPSNLRMTVVMAPMRGKSASGHIVNTQPIMARVNILTALSV